MKEEKFNKLTDDFKSIAYHSKTWEEIEKGIKERIKDTERNEDLINALIDLIGCFKQAENSYKETVKKAKEESEGARIKYQDLDRESYQYKYELAKEQIKNKALLEQLEQITGKRYKLVKIAD